MDEREVQALERITKLMEEVAVQLKRLALAAERAYPTPEMEDRTFVEADFVEVGRPREVEQKDYADEGEPPTNLPPYGIGKQPGVNGWGH